MHAGRAGRGSICKHGVGGDRRRGAPCKLIVPRKSAILDCEFSSCVSMITQHVLERKVHLLCGDVVAALSRQRKRPFRRVCLLRPLWCFLSVCVLEHRPDLLFCSFYACAQLQGITGVYRMKDANFHAFSFPRKVITVSNPERSQRLCDHKIVFLRCYIAAKTTSSFVIVENPCGEICTFGKVVY